MKTTVFSRVEFAKYVDSLKHIPENLAFIEIENDDEKFYFNYDDDHIIRLRFCDAEQDEAGCMTICQGRQLIKFIRDNYGRDFIIHCAAGQSRSAAVQRFILDCFPEYSETIHKEFANWHVVTLLKRLYYYEDNIES